MSTDTANQSKLVGLTKIDRIVVIAATFWFLTFGVVSAFVTHAFTFFPDSRQHHHYIQVLLSGRMPFLTDKKINQEEHQPPLYYVTSMPWLKLGEHWGTEGGVVAVRLWTLFLASGVIVLTTLIARQLVRKSMYVPGLAAIIVGMNPQFYVMSAEVNNDALASLLGSALLLCLVRLLIGWKPTKAWNIIIGLLTAAAFLTKMSLWPIVAFVVVLAILKQPRRWSTAVQLLTPLIIVASWWLTRNTLLYGEPTALQKQKDYFYAIQHQEFLTPHGVWIWLTLLFETYWGRFRHFTAGMHYQTYAALKIATVIAVSGLLLFMGTTWRKLETRLRWGYVGLAASFLMVTAGVLGYNLNFYQPQGRYLFPTQAAIAFFLALGLDAVAPRRWKVFMAGAVLTGLLLLNISALRVIIFWG